MSIMSIAVTGATGALGSLVIATLLERVPADQIIALARTPEKAAALAEKGVEVRAFDYDRIEQLAPALQGVDRLLLISSDAVGQRAAQHARVVSAAREVSVERLVYTSILGLDDTVNPLAEEHRSTETLLAESGLSTVRLRNGWYSENYLSVLDDGRVLTSSGEGRVSSAARADYAAAAVEVLLADAPEAVYELGGDVAWSADELGSAAAEALGVEVPVANLSREEHTAALSEAGLPEDAIAFVTGIDAAIARGDLAGGVGAISALTGAPTTPLVETLRAARRT